jgi:hypothetical protein
VVYGDESAVRGRFAECFQVRELLFELFDVYTGVLKV